MEIIDIAHSEGILIVEDNPYGLLWFDQAPPPAMRAASGEMYDMSIVMIVSFRSVQAPDSAGVAQWYPASGPTLPRNTQ